MLLAAALLVAFVRIEQRSAAPLVRLGIFRNSLLVRTNAAGLLYMAAFFGFQLVLTLYLQDLRGWSPLETGLTFAIMGIDLILAPLLTPRLVRRWGNVPVMVAGFVAATLAYGLLPPARATTGATSTWCRCWSWWASPSRSPTGR